MSIYKTGIWTSENNFESNDVYNHKYSDGNFPTVEGWTKTRYIEYTNYHLEREKPTSSTWPNMACPAFQFIIGNKYMWRCWVRCNTCTAGVSLSFRASRVRNDWVTSMKQVCNPTLADGQWHEYYIIQTVPETFDRSGTTMTSAPLIEYYTSDLKSATTDTIIVDFDIRDAEVISTDEYVSMQAFLEEGNIAKIFKDQTRGLEFIEI